MWDSTFHTQFETDALHECIGNTREKSNLIFKTLPHRERLFSRSILQTLPMLLLLGEGLDFENVERKMDWGKKHRQFLALNSIVCNTQVFSLKDACRHASGD